MTVTTTITRQDTNNYKTTTTTKKLHWPRRERREKSKSVESAIIINSMYCIGIAFEMETPKSMNEVDIYECMR